MVEPSITCPKCKTEIRLTESLAAPLIEATRQQFEEKLSRKDEEIAQGEHVLREKEKQGLQFLDCVQDCHIERYPWEVNVRPQVRKIWTPTFCWV